MNTVAFFSWPKGGQKQIQEEYNVKVYVNRPQKTCDAVEQRQSYMLRQLYILKKELSLSYAVLLRAKHIDRYLVYLHRSLYYMRISFFYAETIPVSHVSSWCNRIKYRSHVLKE